MDKLKVAIVGATGVAGQQFVSALAGHPWFSIAALSASERSAGKAYREALSANGGTQWFADGAIPAELEKEVLIDSAELDAAKYDVVFIAVGSDAAKAIEPGYAKTTPVISTASAFRYESDVPLIIPGVNLEHAALIDAQKKKRGFEGFIAPIPNCTTTGLAASLAPLRAFGIKEVMMVSMQAVSGAGRSPGVAALDIIDNVIPFIDGEEEKVAAETKKILGNMEGGAISPHSLDVSCSCNRVNVREGHSECVFAQLESEPEPDEVVGSWESFDPKLGVPSAPGRFIIYSRDAYRPQPRLDRDNGAGMATTVGRLRKPGRWYQWNLVSHNTKMGAAKGAVLLAECLRKQGYL
jgi:aspartate-semialdehyde dehydrogenase